MDNTQIFAMADRLKALQEEKKSLEANVKALGAEIGQSAVGCYGGSRA